jgi:hypothetical protein
VGKMMKYLQADMEEKGRKKLQFSEKKRYRASNTENNFSFYFKLKLSVNTQ